jgi:hypothetical protein
MHSKNNSQAPQKNINQINFAHKNEKETCEFVENLHTKQGDFAHSRKIIKDAKQSEKRKNKTNKQ